MAKLAEVYDCWARYGSELSFADASLLVGVTNWSSSDVAKYFHTSPQDAGVEPTVSVDSFSKFVDLVESWRERPARIPASRAAELPYQETLELVVSDLENVPL
jgi:hypothetical protein